MAQITGKISHRLFISPLSPWPSGSSLQSSIHPSLSPCPQPSLCSQHIAAEGRMQLAPDAGCALPFHPAPERACRAQGVRGASLTSVAFSSYGCHLAWQSVFFFKTRGYNNQWCLICCKCSGPLETEMACRDHTSMQNLLREGLALGVFTCLAWVLPLWPPDTPADNHSLQGQKTEVGCGLGGESGRFLCTTLVTDPSALSLRKALLSFGSMLAL